MAPDVRTIVEKVEALLLEDESFSSVLEKWCEDHCDIFDVNDDAEHSLEYTALHTVRRTYRKT